MQPRHALLLDAWIRLGAVLLVAVLANLLAARHFARLDLTRDHLYTLSGASRAIAGRLEKPLLVKVYFTRGLEAPYNNHQQVFVDRLEEFRAFSRGRMEVTVLDPTGSEALEDEAQRFGIQPIQYRYQGSDRAELKRVFMGASFVYGERQAALEAVTQLGTMEYEIARVLKRLLAGDERPTVGFTSGSAEVAVLAGSGPLETLRTELAESYEVVQVPLGAEAGVPDDVDALLVVGPQQPVTERTRYQLDQYLLRGGSLAVFLTHVRPDLRTFRPEAVYTAMEGLLGAWGVSVQRDLVVDRTQNGLLRIPVRRGRYVVQTPVNHPVIPRITDLATDSLVVKGLGQLLFPFASSLALSDPLPPGVEARVLARTSPQAGRVRTIRTLDPAAWEATLPGEEVGAWPVLVALTGAFPSAFRGLPIPPAPSQASDDGSNVPEDDQASRIAEGAPARLVVCGSADAVANNVGLVLNVVDWMVEDEDLIGIRTKSLTLPPLEKPAPSTLVWMRAAAAGGGILLLGLAGLGRWLWRRRRAREARP